MKSKSDKRETLLWQSHHHQLYLHVCNKVLWAAMFRSVKRVSVLVARPVSLQASVTAFTLIMALLCFCAPHWNDGSKSNLHMAALIARSPAALTSQAEHFRDCPFMYLRLFFGGGALKIKDMSFTLVMSISSNLLEKVTVIHESWWTLMSNRKKSKTIPYPPFLRKTHCMKAITKNIHALVVMQI